MRSLLVLLIVPLLGCTLGLRKQAVVPPPPKPAAVQPPAPDPPLSIPQTAVTLPSPQLVNPDAIPPAPTAPELSTPEKTEAPPAPRPPRRAAAGPPKPDPEPETETPPTPAVQGQPPFQPLVSGQDQKRMKGVIEGRKKEITERLDHATGHLSDQNKSLVEHIHAFLVQCDDAEKRGDYAQAEALSERALIVARELQGE